MFSSSNNNLASTSATTAKSKSLSPPPTTSSPPKSTGPIQNMVTPVAATASTSSAPSSPIGKRRSLGVADVANIFVKMRRTSHDETKRAKSSSSSSPSSYHIESSSGQTPQSHPGLLEAVTCAKRERLEHTDVFVCIGGVNVPLLLRATRTTIMEIAEMVGANVLVDEQWTCTIRGNKNRSNGTFKVQIHYLASATRADMPDPHKPVALRNAKGVPGLMTILKRED